MLPALRNHTPANLMTRPVNRLESVFDRVFGPIDRIFDWDTDFFTPTWTAAALPVNLWDDEENVYVEAELPGVDPKDIDCSVQDGRLVIRAERKSEEGRKYLYTGRTYGRFEQVISLPHEVQAEEAKAELAHGILRLTLPKSPDAKPRKINIQVS